MKQLILFILLTTASPLYAQWLGDNKQSEFYLGFSLQDVNYKEFDDTDFLLDREDGLLPGITGQFTVTGLNFDSSLFASYHSSTIDYDGYTQPGYLPVQTDTDTDVIDFEYYISEKASEKFRLYGGLGYRYWRRNIRSTTILNGGLPVSVAGLLEQYDWFYGLLGIKKNIFKDSYMDVGFDFRLTHMLKANMDIDFLGYAGLDDTTVDLGKKTNFRLAMPWRYRMPNSYGWVIEPYFEQWDIGKSNTVNLTSNGVLVTGCPGIGDPCGVLEPRSETRNFGVNLQMVMPF